MKRINACTSGPERKAALCGLLEQEAQLIASIGRHRITANQENKVEETHRLLDAVRQCVGCWGCSVRSGPVVADMWTALNTYIHTYIRTFISCALLCWLRWLAPSAG